MTFPLALFVAVPLGAAFLILLVKSVTPRAASPLTILAMAALLALAGAAALGGPGTDRADFMGGWGVEEVAPGQTFVAGIALVLDGLSRLFLLVIGVVSLAVAVFAGRYMEASTGKPLFYALFNLIVAGMCGAVLAADLFNLFVFLEVASIASYALVAFGTKGREVEAAFKYLLLGAVASSAILLGIGVVYASTGYLNMADVAGAIQEGRLSGLLLHFVAALFLMGFGLKAAMMPFHAWLPDAHPSAPAPISAMLSGLLIKTLGIYALIRVFYVVIGIDPRVQAVLLGLGCLSMVAGVLLAYGQDDLKRLLAYSSISQMGYVLVALGIDTWLGVVAAVFHAMNHAMFKSALFLASGSLERISGTRDLSAMGGVARRAPWTAAGTMGAALSIAGVPPFNGFWSKALILVALFASGHALVGGIAAATAVLTLITFVRVMRGTLFAPLAPRLAEAREVPASMWAPVLGLVALCFLTIALWPLGLGRAVEDAASAVRSTGTRPSPTAYRDLIQGRQP